MNKYIIYTTKGYCESPDGEEISNCQVLGKTLGSDKDDAIKSFLTSILGFNRAAMTRAVVSYISWIILRRFNLKLNNN